jgi:hypothetical protein
MSNLGLLVSNLDQGIAYYFRVAAINAVGRGPYALAATPFAVPLLRQPGMPIVPTLNVVDGTSLIVGFQPPALDGGSNINNYKVYIFICICICMYVCVRICMYIYVYACIYIFQPPALDGGSNINNYKVYIFIFMYVCVCTYVYVRMCMYVYAYMHVYVCIYIFHPMLIITRYMYIYVYVCMCMYIYTFKQQISVFNLTLFLIIFTIIDIFLYLCLPV